MILTGQVIGVERQLLQLRNESAAARTRVGRTVEKLGIETQRVVKALYLSGAALGVRTGNLRRSVNEEYSESSDVLTSSVGTNVVYGRFWELGFKRTFVRHKTTAQGIIEARDSNVEFAPRPFLQPALDDMKPRISSELAAAAARP